MDSAGTATYKRDGAGVTAPVLSDSSAVYTPGISERRSSTTKFYGTDRLGTNSLETNSSQTVTSTKTYDAFGMLQASTGSSASPFGFAGAHGYQEDADSGLKLLGHRYYDASTGRFLTRDPIKDGRNWYTYCDNNPVTRVDPNGQWWQIVAVALVVVAVAVYEYWQGNSAGGSGADGTGVGGYALPSPVGEMAGAAPAAAPMIGLAYEAKARRGYANHLSEDPYDDGGDPYRNYDQPGDTSGSLTAKEALRNWVDKN